ncbi:MAG TPA: nuclear transport factor 2 family protein [Candidatus Bathyarchaeia archaeon]
MCCLRNRICQSLPSLRFDLKRIIAEGDLVTTHSHMTLDPTDHGSAVMDIFRVENGKIVEHWDVSQQIPAQSANNNTMF